MELFAYLPFVAAGLSLIVGCVSLLRPNRSFPTWCFFAGMTILAADSFITGLSLRAPGMPRLLGALTAGFVVKSLLPPAWLAFGLTYSRGNYRESLARWKYPLAAISLGSIALSLLFREQLLELASAGSADEGVLVRFGPIAKALNSILILANVWILMNLEQTFRSAVGTMRWRVKFVILGLSVIIGARTYVGSQALLFPAYDVRWAGIESSALFIGCVCLIVAYARTGFAEIDVYPSRAVLGSSVTLLVVGGYLFSVGVLANAVRRFGGAEAFQMAAFVVLLGMCGVAALLLSDRLRQRIHGYVARHFARAQHDSVRIWTEFSRRLAAVKDETGLCMTSARLVSEAFEILSVSVWLVDKRTDQLLASASTAQTCDPTARNGSGPASSEVVAALRQKPAPFEFDAIDEPWGVEFRRLNPSVFPNGGCRWCVPLRAGNECLGAVVLADRVNAAPYTVEELGLLQCIAHHVTSVLLNLRLAEELARSRELEAFRTMSAFFIHDLKNVAATLNLTLKNFQARFDDAEFRQDAFRAIGNTAQRIDQTIARLTNLRQRPEFKPVEADLNRLVAGAIAAAGEMPQVELSQDLRQVPPILADPNQLESVVLNLVLNARDAVGPAGRIRVGTAHFGDNVVLTVADNGCGMSSAFLKDSLFRPFQTTKKKGLGIGMFQSRMIIEAHGGTISVESEAGKGSTFRVALPANHAK